MFYTSCGIDKKTSKGWRGYLLYKDEEGKAKRNTRRSIPNTIETLRN